MDSANKGHQALFQISMMYYHLYPVMLIAGFPVVKPAYMYEVAHPLVWAGLLDYVLCMFHKTAGTNDLNIKYYSQEFQNISEEVYSGFRQIVASAEPHEIMDIYRDAFVGTGAKVGGGNGDLFSAMFPAQTGGGGPDGPNNTALATGVAGPSGLAQRRGAVTATYAESQLALLASRATLESADIIRSELSKILDSIRGDISYMDAPAGKKLSTFGIKLKASIDASIEATQLGNKLKDEASSLSPYCGPCGMVCNTFTNKFVWPAVAVGGYIVTQTETLEEIKKALGFAPVVKTWAWTDVISKPISWVVGTAASGVGAVGSGIFGGLTGLELSVPCVIGTIACGCATKCCVDTTQEYIKMSKKISKTKELELRLLNKIKSDVFKAALRNIHNNITAYVGQASGLLANPERAVAYIEAVSAVPVTTTNLNYKKKLNAIEKRSNKSNDEKRTMKEKLMFDIKAERHAIEIMESQFREWADLPLERIQSLIDVDKKKGYFEMLKDIESANKDLTEALTIFKYELNRIGNAPGASVAKSAASAASMIAAFVPAVAPALLTGTATFRNLASLGNGAAEGSGTCLAQTYVQATHFGAEMLATSTQPPTALAAAPQQQLMQDTPSGTLAIANRTQGGRRATRKHRKSHKSRSRRR